MPLLIGTDEAGYGPNLGPLVVTGTAWSLPFGMRPEELHECLADVVTETSKRGETRLHVADSKKVYSAGKSIASLERGVLAFLKTLGLEQLTIAKLACYVAGDSFTDDYETVCQKIVSERTLPVSADLNDVESAAEKLTSTLAAANVRLLSIRSRIIFPPEFNRGVAATDSKGKVLSAATLSLVRELTQHPEAGSDGWVICDKHGGRNRYDDVISQTFDDRFVFRIEESRVSSRYRLDDLEFCFRTKAEEVLPVALASMVCKYVREIVMMQFNTFWQHHLPNLKPTKGYPQDARRFWEDIAGKAAELGIEKSAIWRVR